MFNSSQYAPSSSQYSPYGHESQYGRASVTPGPAQGGLGGSTAGHGHSPTGNTWGASSAGGMGGSLNDPFGQSRSTYQQGYILVSYKPASILILVLILVLIAVRIPE